MSGFSHSIEVALDNGNASLVIATESHRAHSSEIKADAVDVDAAVERGLLILLDVADSLSSFTIDTSTDENRSAGMPYTIIEAVRRAEERHLHVAVGWECIPALWAQGKADAAIHQERSWEELARTTTLTFSVGAYRKKTGEKRTKISS